MTVCDDIRMHVCMYVCTYVRTYVCMYVCVCTKHKYIIALCFTGFAGYFLMVAPVALRDGCPEDLRGVLIREYRKIL